MHACVCVSVVSFVYPLCLCVCVSEQHSSFLCIMCVYNLFPTQHRCSKIHEIFMALACSSCRLCALQFQTQAFSLCVCVCVRPAVILPYLCFMCVRAWCVCVCPWCPPVSEPPSVSMHEYVCERTSSSLSPPTRAN